MNIKFIRLPVFLATITVSTIACASDKPCFKDVASYLSTTFGPSYKDDKNLIVRPRVFGTQTLTEFRDITAGTNIKHVLFRQDRKRGLCMVLKSYPVTNLIVTKSDKAGMPLRLVGTDRASGTEAENEITYTLSENKTYEATRCRKFAFNESKPRLVSEVPCSEVLLDQR